MNMPNASLAMLLICSVFSFLATPARAEVYQSDDFDYPKGPLQSQEGGDGWNGPWKVSGMGNTIANSFDLGRGKLPGGYKLTVAPNVLQLSLAEKSQRASRKFTPPINLDPSSPRVLYFSFVFCRLDTSDQQGNEVFGFSFSSGGNRVLGFDVTSTENLQLSYVPTKKSITGEKRVIEFTDTVQTSPRYVFVGRITANPAGQMDRLEYSAFDATRSMESEPQVWDLSLEVNAAETLDSVDFVAAPFLRNILIDNLRIGSDFSAVTRP
ncbi:MAG: hypothetical protein E6Q40_07205 [Cupriavidus sp.]|nr:MAG: hypothetical protein E6Q40_07205 [Cupriavidus sp.]